jgi:hypothetical protein
VYGLRYAGTKRERNGGIDSIKEISRQSTNRSSYKLATLQLQIVYSKYRPNKSYRSQATRKRGYRTTMTFSQIQNWFMSCTNHSPRPSMPSQVISYNKPFQIIQSQKKKRKGSVDSRSLHQLISSKLTLFSWRKSNCHWRESMMIMNFADWWKTTKKIWAYSLTRIRYRSNYYFGINN